MVVFTPLFTLPLELRQLVYKAVLASPCHGPELLRTCREIHSEAHEFLFQRPLSFRSQLALFDWLNRVPHKYLPQAKALSVTIQDVDLRSLLRASALVSDPGTPPRLLTWDLYEAELDRLSHALRQMSNIREITIRTTSGQQSFLYREFLHTLLSMLGSLYPGFLDLRLEGNFHHQELSFLSKFKKLQAFSFDGLSASSPTETARVLSGLHHLASLSLVSQSTMLTSDSRTHSGLTAKRQPFTGGIVSTVDSLACFSVTETVPVSAPTLFFTPEVLASLQNHRSLKTFKVCLSQAPDDDTMAALESFLERTRIETLELDWPDLDPQIFEAFSLIPEYLKWLWVRARSATDAFDIIWSIAESRNAGDLRSLSELVLVRSTPNYDIVGHDRKDSGTGETESDYDTVSSFDCLISAKQTDTIF